MRLVDGKDRGGIFSFRVEGLGEFSGALYKAEEGTELLAVQDVKQMKECVKTKRAYYGNRKRMC